MLLSLVRFVNTGVLIVHVSWDNTNASMKARCSGLVGVREHIKDRLGKHGNTGEPNVSTRDNAGRGQPQEQQTRLIRELVASDQTIRISDRRTVVFEPRETEGKEKGEGSLSISIVPIESREIMTDESR